MAKRGRKDAARHINNLTTVIVAIGFAVVGAVLLLISALSGGPAIWLPSLLGQLGGLLLATGLITLVWDLVGKRAFADEVLSKVQLRADLVESGLERLTHNYLTDVEWDALFKRSRSIDIVVAYGSTWRNSNRARLTALAKRGGSIRVFLPDPNDPQTMSVLAARFKMSPDSLRAKIHDSIDDFRSYSSIGNVEIYVRAGDAVFSCYQFDHSSVLTLYSHSQQRLGSVPSFLVGEGFLRDFIASDVEAIKNQSTKI